MRIEEKVETEKTTKHTVYTNNIQQQQYTRYTNMAFILPQPRHFFILALYRAKWLLGAVDFHYTVGAVEFHRARIGILQQLHMEQLRLIYFQVFYIYIYEPVSPEFQIGHKLQVQHRIISDRMEKYESYIVFISK